MGIPLADLKKVLLTLSRRHSEELVELINGNYESLISLGSHLNGLDAYIMQLLEPLQETKVQLQERKAACTTILDSLTSELAARDALKNEKNVYTQWLSIHHTLSKMEAASIESDPLVLLRMASDVSSMRVFCLLFLYRLF